jgi:hypothetical protein
MLTLLTAATAQAGPIVETTPHAVQGGLGAAWRIAWILALCAAPFLGWFFHRQFSLHREARRSADEHRKLP